MRATIMYGAGDVRVENVPDPSIVEPTDAIVRVIRASICGSDLWPYKGMAATEAGRPMGHEAIGIVEATGSGVRSVKRGNVVIVPFAISDGTCTYCLEGLPTACANFSFVGNGGMDGAQAEALRIPFADGTLYSLDVAETDARITGLLTLADVMGTGHHAALAARVAPGKRVVVIGDGAVGLCGVIAAKRLGAEQIVIVGRHPERLALARAFGATDVVRERGEDGTARARELTGGHGAHSVLECVGTREALVMCLDIARPGGAVGRVGVPQYEDIPAGKSTFFRNITVSGGPASVRSYIDKLLPDILEGRIEPGRIFNRAVDLSGVPDGYRAMNERESIKVLVTP
ncbi:MAG: alcohol dehydrogenase catalytic domain-containing protein [Kofleriaceae bacterium]